MLEPNTNSAIAALIHLSRNDILDWNHFRRIDNIIGSDLSCNSSVHADKYGSNVQTFLEYANVTESSNLPS